MSSLDSFEFLQRLFPGRLFVSPVEAGACIGWKPRSVYNRLNEGKFPFAITIDVCGNKAVSVLDLAAMLAQRTSVAAGGEYQPPAKPKKRGAPTKRQRIERLRQQQNDAEERAELERRGQQRLEVV